MDISLTNTNPQFIYILQHSFITDVVRVGASEKHPELIAQELSHKINLPGEYQVISSMHCANAQSASALIKQSIKHYQTAGGFYQLTPEHALKYIKRDTMRIPVTVTFNNN
ncbi:hypothetical protein tinsulaeT_10960 [Thalassotalea insulae]|uniref:Uncharacterized protein n=1 Tax=Thalassotalea insulae TaxID=2056778 RepID=A0ABQ6GPE8_9GAMM|nr:hypothetical protein [Thalassotalea insulae]GLX77756.1 hypothetical protein tinsulaeT_10960 [Thalassotalea insulae]